MKRIPLPISFLLASSALNSSLISVSAAFRDASVFALIVISAARILALMSSPKDIVRDLMSSCGGHLHDRFSNHSEVIISGRLA